MLETKFCVRERSYNANMQNSFGNFLIGIIKVELMWEQYWNKLAVTCRKKERKNIVHWFNIDNIKNK